MVDLGLNLFKSVLSASFIALKWKKDLVCLLAEIHEIAPNVFFYPSGYLASYLPSVLRKLLKISFAWS